MISFIFIFNRCNLKNYRKLRWEKSSLTGHSFINQGANSSLPLGWRAKILNDGDLPEREEHIFAYEIEPNPNHPEKRFAYYKSRGKITLKEAYVTGM